MQSWDHTIKEICNCGGNNRVADYKCFVATLLPLQVNYFVQYETAKLHICKVKELLAPRITWANNNCVGKWWFSWVSIETCDPDYRYVPSLEIIMNFEDAVDAVNFKLTGVNHEIIEVVAI